MCATFGVFTAVCVVAVTAGMSPAQLTADYPPGYPFGANGTRAHPDGYDGMPGDHPDASHGHGGHGGWGFGSGDGGKGGNGVNGGDGGNGGRSGPDGGFGGRGGDGGESLAPSDLSHGGFGGNAGSGGHGVDGGGRGGDGGDGVRGGGRGGNGGSGLTLESPCGRGGNGGNALGQGAMGGDGGDGGSTLLITARAHAGNGGAGGNAAHMPFGGRGGDGGNSPRMPGLGGPDGRGTSPEGRLRNAPRGHFMDPRFCSAVPGDADMLFEGTRERMPAQTPAEYAREIGWEDRPGSTLGWRTLRITWPDPALDDVLTIRAGIHPESFRTDRVRVRVEYRATEPEPVMDVAFMRGVTAVSTRPLEDGWVEASFTGERSPARAQGKQAMGAFFDEFEYRTRGVRVRSIEVADTGR